MGTYFIKLFDIAVGLDALAGKPGGLGHGVPGEDTHNLLNLEHRGGGSSFRGFANKGYSGLPSGRPGAVP